MQVASNTPSRKKENPGPPLPPFDQRTYTVREAAKIFQISDNEARKLFANEPGVFDLSLAVSSLKKRTRKRRRRQLRIPHQVLLNVLHRCEIRKDGAA